MICLAGFGLFTEYKHIYNIVFLLDTGTIVVQRIIHLFPSVLQTSSFSFPSSSLALFL